MAKGFKLKKLLSHYKEEEKYVEEEARRKKKQEEQLEKEAPKVVSSDDVKEAQRRQLEEEAESEEQAGSIEEGETEEKEEYHSKALSRKERRRLKKLEKKQKEQQQEQDDEAEEEGQSESENDEERTSLPLEKLAESASESEDEDMDVNDSEEEQSDEDEEEDDDDDVSEVDDNMTVEETMAKLKEMKERKERMKKENENENKDDLKTLATTSTEKSDDEKSDVPLSDVEFDSDADIVPHQKLTINNAKALNDALARIQLPWAKHSFEEHQSVTSETNTDSTIKDIYDDTERELAFYRQSLDAVTTARAELKRLKLPFLRPLDYFAEMVKSDEHMDKIKNVLVREASERKAREEARKQRQLKKFGKQVQIATLQKRQKEKRETLDRIKTLKKKRQHSEITGDDFDVGIEEATRAKTRANQGARKKVRRGDADTAGSSHIKVKKNRPGKSRRSRRHH